MATSAAVEVAAAAAAVITPSTTGVRFVMREGGTLARQSLRLHPVSPRFDLDRYTVASVVLWAINCNPAERNCTWRVGRDEDRVVGVDVPLTMPLRAFLRSEAIGRGTSDAPIEILFAHTNSSDQITHIRFALAAYLANLSWPIWRPGVLDTTASVADLAVLRRHPLEAINIHTLLDESTDSRVHLATSRRADRVLPIIDLATGARDDRYGIAIASLEEQARAASISGDGIDFHLLTEPRRRIREFIHAHPWLPLSAVETHAWDDHVERGYALQVDSAASFADTIAFAHDEYARMERTIGTDTYNEAAQHPISLFFESYVARVDRGESLDMLAGAAEFNLACGMVSYRQAREYRHALAAVRAIHARHPVHGPARLALVQQALQADYSKAAIHPRQTPAEVATRAVVLRRPPNQLVDLLTRAYHLHSGSHNIVPPSELEARMSTSSIRATPREQRVFRQLMVTLTSAYERFTRTPRSADDRMRVHIEMVATMYAAGSSEAIAAARALAGAAAAFSSPASASTSAGTTAHMHD